MIPLHWDANRTQAFPIRGNGTRVCSSIGKPMSNPLHVLAAAVLFLHALLLLLGTAVYLRLAEPAEFRFKTTLLGGAWDLGTVGIRAFGLLWAVAALGFTIAAVAYLQHWPSWGSLLAGVTLFSLLLTMLDWTVAYAGIVVNVTILVMLVLLPRL